MRILTILLFLIINLDLFAQISKIENVEPFIPVDYQVLDSKTGDLNKDAYPDIVLVLKAKEEDEQKNEDLTRPLILLAGTASGKYKLIARNDSVVLCKSCGGIFGDPYEGITINNGYFSVEHYGGSNWRWTRMITFKYDLKSKEFKLHRDAGISFHTSDPNKQKNERQNKKDWGKLSLKEFSNEKILAE